MSTSCKVRTGGQLYTVQNKHFMWNSPGWLWLPNSKCITAVLHTFLFFFPSVSLFVVRNASWSERHVLSRKKKWNWNKAKAAERQEPSLPFTISTFKHTACPDNLWLDISTLHFIPLQLSPALLTLVHLIFFPFVCHVHFNGFMIITSPCPKITFCRGEGSQSVLSGELFPHFPVLLHETEKLNGIHRLIISPPTESVTTYPLCFVRLHMPKCRYHELPWGFYGSN